MTLVFGVTPLIYLAEADHIGVVETLGGPRLVPELVYQEVVTEGIEAGYDDARRIERAVEDILLNTIAFDANSSSVATRLVNHPGLSNADVAVLACADTRDAVAVMDESVGRSTTEVEDIETRGTAYVVLSSVKDRRLSAAEGQDAIDTMVDAGWYVAPDVYATIVRKLESFESN